MLRKKRFRLRGTFKQAQPTNSSGCSQKEIRQSSERTEKGKTKILGSSANEDILRRAAQISLEISHKGSFSIMKQNIMIALVETKKIGEHIFKFSIMIK